MGDGDEVQIEPVLTATDEVRSLVGELDAVLSAEYSPEQRHGLTPDAIFQPHVRFFLARLRGAAVGCGGVYLFPDFAEVKRMYVRHTARGQGVADAILAPHRSGGPSCRDLRVASGDGRPADRGDAALCANGIPGVSGVRRLRNDGNAIHCEQCVLREADWHVARLGRATSGILSFPLIPAYRGARHHCASAQLRSSSGARFVRSVGSCGLRIRSPNRPSAARFARSRAWFRSHAWRGCPASSRIAAERFGMPPPRRA